MMAKRWNHRRIRCHSISQLSRKLHRQLTERSCVFHDDRDTWTPAHRAEVDKAVSAQGFSLQGVTVRCETLAALLSAPRWAGREVDLLTVAVEGHELQVLQSVDWAATVVNVVQVRVRQSEAE